MPPIPPWYDADAKQWRCANCNNALGTQHPANYDALWGLIRPRCPKCDAILECGI